MVDAFHCDGVVTLKMTAETIQMRIQTRVVRAFLAAAEIVTSSCFKIQSTETVQSCQLYAFSFANCFIDAWNSLDNDVLCASSVQALKRRLSLQYFTKFLYVL